MNRNLKLLLLLFAFLLSPLICQRIQAQTINAASCSQTDVQTAFSAVTNSTTTVNIPAGTCHWSSPATLTVPSGNTNISVLGAGNLTTTGGGDQTVIIDDYSSNNDLLSVVSNSTSTSVVRVAGITVQGGAGQIKDKGMIGVGGGSAKIRFDHDHFNSQTYSPSNASTGMRWTGCTYGVIDHSIFDQPAGGVNNAVQADNSGACFGDSLGVGDQSWAHPTALGTATFLYMEDNVFNNGASNDCTFGGRFVERYNTFNTSAPAPSVQTHPTGGAGRIRGCRAWEIYGNTYAATSGQFINTAFFASAGTGVVWSNTLPSSSAGGGTGYKIFIEMHSMRRDNVTYGEAPAPNGWGYCGTSFNGTGSNWDQNSNPSTGYRCLDQPGQGMGDLLTGGFSFDGSGSNNATNSATGCTASSSCAWPRQALEPVYEWMDNYSCVPSNPCNFESSYDAGAFVNNSDYYLWCSASSTSGCTTFNGTVGTGSGLLASRPSSCTAGVAYWATDASTLYKCASTNTWATYYQPYVYPHPLVSGGGGSSSSAPSAPTNLTVVVN
jgi:hypothetical protein